VSKALGLRAAARRRKDVDDFAAAERAARGLVAHDEAVAAQRTDRLLEDELHQAAVVQERDAAENVRRADMHMHRLPVLELFKGAKTGIEAAERRRHLAADDPVAARHRTVDAGEVQREALPRAALRGRRIVRVDRANAAGGAAK